MAQHHSIYVHILSILQGATLQIFLLRNSAEAQEGWAKVVMRGRGATGVGNSCMWVHSTVILGFSAEGFCGLGVLKSGGSRDANHPRFQVSRRATAAGGE